MEWDPNRPVGFESRKAYARRCATGLWDRFIPGSRILDIGFQGGLAENVPIAEGAIGIEPGFPGYDGFRLPFEDGSVDCVHSSHMLEHVDPPADYIREWFRVVREEGTLIIMVPHAFLYERRLTVPPSRWSRRHLRAYTPQRLLLDIEEALLPNTYRIAHLADNDDGYDYTFPSTVHPIGCLEIECVVRKNKPPEWTVELMPAMMAPYIIEIMYGRIACTVPFACLPMMPSMIAMSSPVRKRHWFNSRVHSQNHGAYNRPMAYMQLAALNYFPDGH